MLIYRGDRSGLAKAWRTDGIMSHLMMGGKPATISLVGFWEAARAHVKSETNAERLFYESTPLLSFSESIERAAQFALGRNGSGHLVLHDAPYGEDTTIFELNIAGLVNDGEPGLFVLDYTCDYSLAVPHGDGPEYQGQEKAVSCEYCAVGNKVPEPRFDAGGRLLHRVQLINVSVFLSAHPDEERYYGARQQAEKDREWLAYPIDYVDRLRGNASRMPLSRIWRALRYKIVAGEAPTS